MDKIKEKLGDYLIERQREEAIRIIDSPEKYTDLIYKLDRKLLDYPMYHNDELKDLITMIDLAKCNYQGSYIQIDREILIVIISTLSYWVSSVDVIPDFIPIIGLLDDESIYEQSLKLVKEELDTFLKWRKKHI